MTTLHPSRLTVAATRPPSRQPSGSGIQTRSVGGGEAQRIRLVPGRVIPGTRYRLVRWLGEGGMGVIYEVEHVDIERRAALKILRVDRGIDPTLAQQFRDEARTASRVGSDHIVEIFDFGELPDGRLLFTMELLEGNSLADEVERAPMEPSRLIAILRQSAKGLAAAHAAGIIHRDIKPENILLSLKNGRVDRVKLVDFGIARMIAAGEEIRESTAAGTPHYMAPEVCMGLPYDGRADMYSLGCTAYELLVGLPPFGGDSVDDILSAHVDREVIPPSKRIPGLSVPPQLEAVIMRALAKRPENRFADLHDFEAALCEAQIAAHLETTWDDLSLPEVDPERRAKLLREMPHPDRMMEEIMRRRRLAWLLAAAVSSGIAVMLAIMLWLRPPPPASEVSQIDELTDEARHAAARAYFVYPAPGDPLAPTAYRKVLELEGLQGATEGNADERGGELRDEFASTLVRLGNRYWNRPGAEGFAIDYYAQALLFRPEHDVARTRVPLTPGELADLRRKAAEGLFTDAELRAVAPLQPLAAPSEEEAREAYQDYVQEHPNEPLSRSGRLKQFLSEEKEPPPETAKVEAEPLPPVEPVAPPEVAKPVREDDIRNSAKTKREPEAARELAKQAEATLRTGRREEAEQLFHRALAKDNRCGPALIGLSDLYFNTSTYARAVEFARRAVAVSPRNATYRLRLGDAYYKVLRYQDALNEYEQGAKLGSSQAQERVSWMREKLGD